jgi:ABC-type Fe3+-hydroxamate transport system substrate-binding protein
MRSFARIVSLVPSLTETVFDLGAGDRLVGVSDYCKVPADGAEALGMPGIPRVGGPKTPDHAAIAALCPDLIILGEEECCRSDFDQFTQLCDVYVATCRSLADGLQVVLELGMRLGAPRAAGSIVARIQDACAGGPAPQAGRTLEIFYPLWPDPWITVSSETFVADILARAGARSIFRDFAKAYPVVDLAEARRRDPRLILLPDEPYPFGPSDTHRFQGFNALGRGAVCCVPGRWAAWYGSRMDAGVAGLRGVVSAHAD